MGVNAHLAYFLSCPSAHTQTKQMFTRNSVWEYIWFYGCVCVCIRERNKSKSLVLFFYCTFLCCLFHNTIILQLLTLYPKVHKTWDGLPTNREIKILLKIFQNILNTSFFFWVSEFQLPLLPLYLVVEGRVHVQPTGGGVLIRPCAYVWVCIL